MNIGKLDTLYRVYDKVEGKDAVGQTSTTYNLVTSFYGQHTIRNMTSTMSANRDNPIVSEYVYCHFEIGISNGMFLIDDLGNNYKIQSVRRAASDRGLLQLSVQSMTDKPIDIA